MEQAVKMTFTNSVRNATKLVKYREQLEKLRKVMSAMPQSISIDNKSISSVKSADNSLKEFSDSTQKSDKAQKSLYKTLLGGGAFIAFTRVLDKVVTSMSRFTSKSADYVENLNLMNVAFHRTEDSIEGATLEGVKFINTLSDMYGLDESALTRVVGNFKQLANAMGVADDVGTKLAKTLTQMSIDVSSLYNVSFERATEVLQSSLAGQTKPIRGLAGADITETTLQLTLDTYGIDTTVRDLSYVEKRLVIVTSLMNQLKESQNDYGRTIESVSNQMRVFNEQTERLSRALGNMFLPILSKILPYLNAFLMVLTEIINAIAKLFGYDKDLMSGFASGVDDITSDFIDLDDSVNGVSDSVSKLKQGLRGFDKLNSLTTPTPSASTGGIGTGINPQVLDAFNSAWADYDNKLEKIKMRATDIRDRVMEILGFTKEVDPVTGEVSFKYGGWQATIKGITKWFSELNPKAKLFVSLGVVLTFVNLYRILSKLANLTGITKLFTGIFDITSKISKVFNGSGGLVSLFSNFSSTFGSIASTLGITTGALVAIVAVIAAIAGAFVYAYSTSEEFREKVNKAVSEVSTTLSTLWKFVKKGFQEFWDFAEPLWNIFWNNASTVVKLAYEEIKADLSLIFDVIGGTFSIINALVNGDYKGAWDSAKEMVKNVYEDYQNKFDSIEEVIRTWAKNTKEEVEKFKNKIIEKLEKVITWFKELPDKIAYWTGYAIGKLWKIVTETDWVQLGKDTLEKIFKGLGKFGEHIETFKNNLFEEMGNKLKNIDWSSIGKFVLQAILDGMSMGLYSNAKKITSWASSFVNGIKDALKINSPSKLVIEAKIGNYVTQGIEVGMDNEIPSLKKQAVNIVDDINSSFRNIKPVEFDSNVKSNFIDEISSNYSSNNNKDSNNNSSLDSIINPTNINSKQPVNATIIVQLGSKEIANEVINDLEDKASANGKPIIIGG